MSAPRSAHRELLPSIRASALAVVLLAVAACSADQANDATVSPESAALPTSDLSTPSATTGAPPSEPAAEDFVVGGERRVVVHVPGDFDRRAATPLLIMLHGYGSSGASHEAYIRLRPPAAEQGLLYAYPDGTEDREGNQFWNATDACCDFGGTGIDDAGYLAGLVEEIGTVATVDPRRIYFVGHSNGGFMSYRMACEHADLVAAIVSVAGASFGTASDCAPSQPVAVLQIHGSGDDTIRYEGGSVADIGAPSGTPPYPGVIQSAEFWAGYDRCPSGLVDASDLVDVDGQIDGPAGPAESTVKRTTDCEVGGHVEVWTIPGGRHSPIPSRTLPDEILHFLLAHPKP